MDHLKGICAAARDLLKQMPKVDLGFFPTPLYKLDHLSEELGVNLYTKRGDSTGMNLFGGNKARKPQYLIGDATAKGCEYVLTFGATQSNHVIQTVSACHRCGLKPMLHLATIVEPDEEDLHSNLLPDRIMGAETHVVRMSPGEEEAETEGRSVQMAREHMKQLETQGHKYYEVPMGGVGSVGSVGFIKGLVEFAEQATDMGIHPDYILHGTRTGGTMAGLAAGKVLTGLDTEIISINASWKDEGYPKCTQDLANESLVFLGAPVSVEASRNIHMDLNYYLPGYKILSESTTEATWPLAQTEGLFIDPVYTGKAFAGMLGHTRIGRVPQGGTVVFWYTEGTTTLFAEKEILGGILQPPAKNSRKYHD